MQDTQVPHPKSSENIMPNLPQFISSSGTLKDQDCTLNETEVESDTLIKQPTKSKPANRFSKKYKSRSKSTNRPSRHGVYLPYEYACQLVRGFGIPSRKKYWEWWNTNKPGYVPKYPNQVYKEWESWNVYLNNDNKYQPYTNKGYVGYWEACRWAQSIASKYMLTSAVTWKEYFDENPGDLPSYIPKQPQTYYKEFYTNGSWTTFLGKTLQGKVKMEQDNDLRLMVLVRYSYQPGSVFSILDVKGGVSDLKGMYGDGSKFRILRVYRYEDGIQGQVQRILNTFASKYSDGEGYISSNMGNVLFELDSVCLIERI
jgi:hypothetical protein